MSCAVEAGADPSCRCRGHGDFLIRATSDNMFGGCFPCPSCFPQAAAAMLARFDVTMLKDKGFRGSRVHDTEVLARLAEKERPHPDLKSLAAAGMKTMRITDMLQAAVTTDGGHHKQWYLEQLAEALEIELPEHDEGIAP